MLKDQKSVCKLQHFCDIMSWGIKKVIEFCKGIPEFIELSVADQIVLLKVRKFRYKYTSKKNVFKFFKIL